jgi:leucyl/phenylalanyl-tRNA--protein transferase
MVYPIRRGRRPVFPAFLVDLPTDLVAFGGDLSVETLIEAYSKGIFPWNGDDPIRWYCPDPRLVLDPREVYVSKSLAKRMKRLHVAIDTRFRAVMEACMTTPRPGQDGTWITPRLIDAYEELHHLGIAHSFETYEDGELIGGLYGLTLGSAFFGESMFAWGSDGSKAALVTLCRNLVERRIDFVDCQQVTPHLMSMGAKPITKKAYLTRLRTALANPSHHGGWRS